MGKIIAYYREGCPHSINTANILSNFNKRDVEIIPVLDNQYAKNDVFNKLNYLINNYKTFPIIIYESSKEKQFFIGGNDTLMNLIKLSKSYQIKNKEKDNILNYIFISCNNLNDGQKRLLYYLIKNNNNK